MNVYVIIFNKECGWL